MPQRDVVILVWSDCLETSHNYHHVTNLIYCDSRPRVGQHGLILHRGNKPEYLQTSLVPFDTVHLLALVMKS